MSDTIAKFFELGNDRDSRVTIDDPYTSPTLKQTPVEVFESSYPDLSREFKAIQQEQYELFVKKML